MSDLHRGQGLAVDCVVARVGETRPSRLAIADIVADHRPEAAATADRAARMFASLPGCSVLLAPDGHGGYLAFTRGGTCFSIRRAQDRGDVPAATAEACAALLYALACTSPITPAGHQAAGHQAAAPPAVAPPAAVARHPA